MKTITLGSFFVLFALVASLATTPGAFADHSEVVIEPVAGSGTIGCQDEDGCYIPMVATVDVGGVVIFSNTDTAAHTFTAGTTEGGPTGEFDSGLALAGTSFEWKPETPGEYEHFCLVHPWMTGLIIVQEAMAGDNMKDDNMEKDHDKEMKDGEMRMDMEPSATGMLSDETMVKVYAYEPMEGEQMKIKVKFVDAQHVNYDLMVMQNGEEVLNDMGVHSHEGKQSHMTAPLSSADPVDVVITFQGYGFGDDPRTGPVGEEVSFANIVPEFGTIAMMVLAVAIISIIAITAKSRVIPRL